MRWQGALGVLAWLEYMDQESPLQKKKEGGMKFKLGISAKDKTWQETFDEEVECAYCRGKAELAFVAYERFDGDVPPYIYQQKKTTGKKGGLWLHDHCAVAVYFCRDCLKPTARYNQG